MFTQIRSDGRHVRSADFRFRYLLADAGAGAQRNPQLAYSISRKVGNAVVRNRIRRRLRAVFAEVLGEHQPVPLSAAVVIVLPGARDLTFAELRDQVLELMKKVDKSTSYAS